MGILQCQKFGKIDKNNCCIDLQSTIPSAGKSYILLTKKYKCKIEVQISSTKYKYKIEVQITCTKYKEQKRKLQNTQRTAALTYIVQKLLRTKRLQSLPLRVDFGGIAGQHRKKKSGPPFLEILYGKKTSLLQNIFKKIGIFNKITGTSQSSLGYLGPE